MKSLTRTTRASLLLLFLLQLALTFAPCPARAQNAIARKNIIEMVRQTKNSLPIESGIGRISDCELIGDQIIYTIDNIDDALIQAYDFSEKAKKGIALINNIDRLAEVMKQANTTLVYKYKSKGGLTKSIIIRPDEFDDLLNSPMSPIDYVNNQVAAVKSALPINLGDGISLTDIRYENTVVSYIYTCDESQIDIDNLNNATDFLKDQAKATLSNDIAAKLLLKSLDQTVSSIAYTYIGNSSRKQCTVVLDDDDIAIMALCANTSTTSPLLLGELQVYKASEHPRFVEMTTYASADKVNTLLKKALDDDQDAINLMMHIITSNKTVHFVNPSGQPVADFTYINLFKLTYDISDKEALRSSAADIISSLNEYDPDVQFTISGKVFINVKQIFDEDIVSVDYAKKNKNEFKEAVLEKISNNGNYCFLFALARSAGMTFIWNLVGNQSREKALSLTFTNQEIDNALPH